MTETMTREHFTQAARTGQEAMSTAVRTWGETVQSALGMAAGRGEVPTQAHLIRVWFDIASEVLDAQREFAEGLLSIGNPAIEAMSRAAQQTAEVIEQATHDASEDVDRGGSAAQRPRAERPERPAGRANATTRKDS